MKKLIRLALLICSFNVSALVGDTHENKAKSGSVRALANTIEIEKGLIITTVEIVIDNDSLKEVWGFKLNECLESLGTLYLTELPTNSAVRSQIVFLQGTTLAEAIVKDMCMWASQHTK